MTRARLITGCLGCLLANPLVGFADPSAAEPPWIYRVYRSSMEGNGPDSLTTYKLERQVDQGTMTASLTVDIRSANNPMDRGGAEPVWTRGETTTYSGAMTTPRKDGQVWLALRSATGDQLELACAPLTVSVARADARRVPDPTFRSECGNRGAWAPASEAKLPALQCINATHDLVFVRGPGIEQVEVGDGCFIQGTGLRRIAADGHVAPPRGFAPKAPIRK